VPILRVHILVRGTVTTTRVLPPGRTTGDECLMTETQHHHGYIHRKDDYVRRLRRIEGQARGLQRMVEEEKYCIDILTQISAITKALQSVGLGLLEEHLSHCVVDAAAAGGRDAEAKLKEATDAIARLVRS
jgi:DNA-binding FrmR family transcriptional regulator